MFKKSIRLFPALILAASAAIGLPACSDELSGKVDTADELLASHSAKDSLIYYLGQVRAYQYWKRTESDTSLRSEEQRKLFLKGVRDGLNMVHEDDPNYNYGLRLGVRMAEAIFKLEDDYDISLSRAQFLRSLRNGLDRTEPINPLTTQAAYYQVLHGMEANRSKEESELNFRSIMGVAEQYDLQRVRSGLWWREVKPGHGPKIRPGDRITLDIDYTQANGESLGMPSPEIQIVGRGSMPQVLTDAYCLMRDGGSAIFATSCQLVFGNRGDLIGMRPTNIVVIHVTVTRVERDSNPSLDDDHHDHADDNDHADI